MKLSGSIHLVDDLLANVYIVTTNQGYLLIDAGLPENFERVISYLKIIILMWENALESL